MQAVASYHPAFTLTSAASSTWKNGVVHADGETDVYELPAAAPGVPSRVELIPRHWGFSREVVATDSQGTRLEGQRDWEGFHRVVVTRDPRTGLETVLDPREQTVTVSTPRVSEKVDGQHGGYREHYKQDARQELDREGNSRYLSGLEGEVETVVACSPPGAGMAIPVAVQDDRSWVETTLRPGQAPLAHRMTATLEGEQQGPALNASLAEGKLEVVGEDGVARHYEMFLRV